VGMRRVFVIGAGFGVLAVGLVMVVLPGPAVIVIPAGLGILARELGWARNLLDRGRKLAGQTKARLFKRVPAGGSARG
jgi:tellurite resistance protein TerC